MKILNFDNYISEKKSISPLTVKQIKGLKLDSPENKMNSLPKSPDDFIVNETEISKDNLHDGIFVVSKDDYLYMYINDKHLYPVYTNDANTCNKIAEAYDVSDGFFIKIYKMLDHSYGLSFMTVAKYDKDLKFTFDDHDYDIKRMYDTNFSYELLKKPGDTIYVLNLACDSGLFGHIGIE